jgi:hypothetical protein
VPCTTAEQINSTWRVAMVEGNEKYAAEHYPDVDLIVTDGQNQAAKQISDVLKGFKDRGVAAFKGMHLDEAEIAAEVKEIEQEIKETNPLLPATATKIFVFDFRCSLFMLFRHVSMQLQNTGVYSC